MMLETVCLGALLSLVLFLYLYFQPIYQHWTRKGLPQLTPIPLVGNVSQAVFMIKNIGMIKKDIYWQYRSCDAVGYYQFLTPKLMLIKPSLFKQVLISEFSNFHDNEMYILEKIDPYLKANSFLIRGDKWKASRSKVIHGLTSSKLRNLFALMSECIPQFDNYIKENLGKNTEAMDMSSLFILAAMSNSVFGIENDCFSDRNTPFIRLSNLLHQKYWRHWWRMMLLFNLQNIRDYLGYRMIPMEISTFMEDMVRNVAETRKKNNINRNDYFQSYLSRDKTYEENVMDLILNGVMFMVAGTNTVAIVCSNTLYALATNPNVQETLYQELRAVYSVNSAPSYDTVMGLPYLDKVIQESLRKYPVTYTVNKVCTETTVMELDGKNVTIEVGTKVTIPTMAVHYDPEYYPDPEVFDPERFSEENKAGRPECTYLPWGEGPRICAGKRFAEMQMKLYVSHLAYSYRILPTEKTPSELTYNNLAILAIPSQQVWIALEKRE